MSRNEIYNDSATKWGNHLDPYNLQHQSNPRLRELRAQNYARSQDTMTSAQAKMHRDILQRLRDQGINLPLGMFLFLGKLGKFTFISFTLPFYLALYAGPKWLATKMSIRLRKMKLPSHSSFPSFSLKNQTSKIAASLIGAARRIAGAITSPILRFIDLSVHKTEQLFKFMASPFYKFGSNLNLFAKSYQLMLDQLSALQKLLGARLSQSSQIFQSGLNLFSQQAATLKETLLAFNHKVSNTTEKLLAPPINKMEQWGAQAAEIVRFLAKPVGDWVHSRWKLGQQGIQAFNDQAAEYLRFFRDKAKGKIRKAIEPITERIDATQKAVAEVMQNVVQIIPQPVFAVLTPLTPAWVFCRKAPGEVAGFASKVNKRIKERLKDQAKKGGVIIYQVAKTTYQLIKKVYQWGMPKLLAAPSKLWSLFKLILRFTVRIVVALFFGLRLILAWIGAIIVFAFIVVKEIGDDLVGVEKKIDRKQG